MAVRAFGDRGRREMVVGPPAILPRFRMSSFGIRHGFASFLPFIMQRGDRPLLRARQSHPALFLLERKAAFENHFLAPSRYHSFLSEAKGESSCGGAQWHDTRFRLAPQPGHKPRQSARQITFMGTERITCSVATSASSIPSPE